MAASQLGTWRDGPVRTAILAFVRSVVAPGPSFVAAADRIATFDNDGTLWVEKPLYPQADFLFRRWGAMAAADPKLLERQPYKAVVTGDHAWLGAISDHVPELLQGVADAFGGITAEVFEAHVRTFFDTIRHPTLDRPYTELTYGPMRDLLDLLTRNDFQVYICTGGGRDFVRVVSDELYAVPRERVIGSAPILAYRDGDLVRTDALEQPIDDGPGKPAHIWARTGRRPLLAGGNSDGDMAMLETARFGLLVHHDDADREFAYDGGAEHALAAAGAQGWVVASMKHDFATVF